MTSLYCVVFCTYPDHATAQRVAEQLVEGGWVACANIVPHLTSIYCWEAKVKQGDEVLMVMKTRQDKLEGLEKEILASHPYSFPEFIAMPIIYGNRAYLKWVDEVTQAE